MIGHGIGQAVPRVEDHRLLSGGGRFTDDLHLAGEAHAFVLRSPLAHARIAALDTTSAREAPGVIAVFTAADTAADGLGDLPCLVPRKRRGGGPMYLPPHPVMVKDSVKMVGDYVALVVAETPVQARDAAELIEVDYVALPSVTATAAALEPGAAPVWEACPDNVCFVYELGDRAAVDAAFAGAAHVTSASFEISRVSAAPMEPRAAIGAFDPFEDRYTLYAGVQGPHGVRGLLAPILNIAESRLRVVSPDMGGAFGMRGSPYQELALVLWAARKVGRPVRWTAERSESFLADYQGRDNVTTAELALDEAGTFLALRVRTVAAMGAYLAAMGPHSPTNNLGGLAGVYTTPAVHVEVTGVFTNTNSTSPYRGAGRPEATFAVERVIDAAARELGIDRAALRRRNIIPDDAMPYRTGLVFTYDCGEFTKNMDTVLAMADYAGFEGRRAEAKSRGRLRGFGLANAIEQAAGAGEEMAELRFDPSGGATLLVGTHSHGQGHETVFRQLLADTLGLAFDEVRFVQGDTDQVAHGRGTFGSRSLVLGGSAVRRAADKVIAKARQIAAHGLETAESDILFADGMFTVAGTDRAMSLNEAARRAYDTSALPPGLEPGLCEHAMFAPPAPTFPNGSHACEIEIDPEAGALVLLRYCVVDDVGRVINPMLLEGQVHGGLVQGIGQVLMEQVVWDGESGQLLAGSFMDYALPRAADIPFFDVGSNEVPTALNPLGAKGAGEAGTVGALACVMSAILDALAPLGIRDFDMPATPARLWRAIHEAR